MDVHAGYNSQSGFSSIFGHMMGKWKGNAIGTPGQPESGDTVTNAVNNVVAEKFGVADNYAYGTMIPTDVDSGGMPIFRTNAQRDEIIKAWDTYQHKLTLYDASGNLKPPLEKYVKGEFSWGEKFDFSESRDIEIPSEKEFSPTIVNGWELQAERARASKATRSKGGLKKMLKQQDEVMIRQGRQVAAQQAGVSPNQMGSNKYGEPTYEVGEAIKDKTEDELRDLGRTFYRDFADRTYNLTQQLLKAIYVDSPMASGDHPTTHLYVWRTADSPREIMGDVGLSGSEQVYPSQVRAEGMPDPSEEKEGESGYSKRIHSHDQEQTLPSSGFS